jgi:hypothetical protein
MPVVTFSISRQMDADQIRVAAAYGFEDVDAETQRAIYEKGLRVSLSEISDRLEFTKLEEELKIKAKVAEKLDRKTEERQAEIAEKQLQVLERLLSVLEKMGKHHNEH